MFHAGGYLQRIDCALIVDISLGLGVKAGLLRAFGPLGVL